MEYAGLAVAGLIELAIALVSGSVALLGDALHNQGWIEATTTVADADRIGRLVAESVGRLIPEIRSFTWTARGI